MIKCSEHGRTTHGHFLDYIVTLIREIYAKRLRETDAILRNPQLARALELIVD